MQTRGPKLSFPNLEGEGGFSPSFCSTPTPSHQLLDVASPRTRKMFLCSLLKESWCLLPAPMLSCMLGSCPMEGAVHNMGWEGEARG